MNFEDKCRFFERKIEDETNKFKAVNMIMFLKNKIEEHNKEAQIFNLNDKIKLSPIGRWWK